MKIKEFLKHNLLPVIMEGVAFGLLYFFLLISLLTLIIQTDRDVFEVLGYVDNIQEYNRGANEYREIYITLENGDSIVIKEENIFSDVTIGGQVKVKQTDIYLLYKRLNRLYRIIQ